MRYILTVLLAVSLTCFAEDDQQRAITVKGEGKFRGSKTIILNGKLYTQIYGESLPVRSKGKPRTVYVDGVEYLLHTSGRVDRLMKVGNPRVPVDDKKPKAPSSDVARRLWFNGREYVIDTDGLAKLKVPEDVNRTILERSTGELKHHGIYHPKSDKGKDEPIERKPKPDPQTTSLFVRSKPNRAVIHIKPANKHQTNRTPRKVELYAGQYVITASKEGYKTTEISVEVFGGGKHDVWIQLPLGKASLDVISDHEWPIYVDGKPYKENGKRVLAPATIRVMKGKHKIEVRYKGDNISAEAEAPGSVELFK